MRVEARDLKAGQTIRTEYGDYDNWVHFEIDKVVVSQGSVSVFCHYKSIKSSLSLDLEDEVEVVQ